LSLRVSGGDGCLPNCGNRVLRLTFCQWGHGFTGGPARRTQGWVRQCWKDLVLTGMTPTIRLFGAGVKLRSACGRRFHPCRKQPACAAAREAGIPDFLPAGRSHHSQNRGESVSNRPNAGMGGRNYLLERTLRSFKALARLEPGRRELAQGSIIRRGRFTSETAGPVVTKMPCENFDTPNGMPGRFWFGSCGRSRGQTKVSGLPINNQNHPSP